MSINKWLITYLIDIIKGNLVKKPNATNSNNAINLNNNGNANNNNVNNGYAALRALICLMLI